MRKPARRRQGGEASVRDLLWQPDVDVLAERSGDLVLKELSETAMARIDAAHQLAFIEPEREGMVRLARAGLPRRLLTGEHHREAIEVGHDAAINGFIEREESSLMCQELADGDLLLSLLRELGPVGGHPLFVVEPAARVREARVIAARPFVAEWTTTMVSSHGSPSVVAGPAPKVHDLLAMMVDAACAT